MQKYTKTGKKQKESEQMGLEFIMPIWKKDRGLIRVNGGKNHDLLVASAIKYLISKLDASPLDIFTEIEIKAEGKLVGNCDILWKEEIIECETTTSLEKAKHYNENRIKFNLVLENQPIQKIFKFCHFPSVKEIWLADLEKQKIVQVENFEEVLDTIQRVRKFQSLIKYRNWEEAEKETFGEK